MHGEQASQNMPGDGVSAATAKPLKMKRPWCNKVRKKARMEAKKMERERRKDLQYMDPGTTRMPCESSSGKDKKKKRKVNHVGNEMDSVGKLSLMEDPVQTGLKKLAAGRFRFLNEQLYTSTGAEAYSYFQKDPEAFFCYHNGFAQQVQKWPNHPLEAIIKWLKKKPNGSVVLDMGCGDAKIAASVGDVHKVHSYDLVAMNPLVVACDMAHLPLEASFADIVVFCLSLMGSNLIDYIKEARRVLKYGGILKIAEVASRFLNVRLFCNALCKMGFEQTEKKTITNYFVILEFRKIGKVENKRPLGLKLKPCLYKRR